MLSVSALSTYLYCQRKLFLQQVMGIFEPKKEATIRGTIRHEIYEGINKREEDIVKHIKSKLSLEEIRIVYNHAYRTLIKEVIDKYKKNLEKFNISPDELHEQLSEIIGDESINRSKNIYGFIERNNVFGEELWQKLTPKIRTEYRIISKKLEITGIIDQLEVYENFIVPVELKTGSCPSDGVWPSHRIQLAAYALLIEEHFNIKVKEGVINYLDAKIKRHIIFNPYHKAEIVDMISLVKELIDAKSPPDIEKNENKCSKCGIRNICHDKEQVEKRLNELLSNR